MACRRTISTLLAGFACFAALPVSAASIKPYVSVEGAKLRLGDFIADAGDAGQLVIGEAPPPGESRVFAAATVAGLAERQGIQLDDTAAVVRITVERKGRLVSPAYLAAQISAQLTNEWANADFEVNLGNRQLAIYVPVNISDAAVQIDGLNFDQRSGRFTASAVVPLGNQQNSQTKISGVAVRMTEVPVLSHALSSGDIIQASDIDWLRVKADRMSQTMVLDMDALVGMSPRRRIVPGRPIRLSDVEAPRMIERGQLVTMVVRHGGMTLTAVGKAVENGGQGDWIRLVNTKSNRTVQGLVTGPGEVVVGGAAMARINTASR